MRLWRVVPAGWIGGMLLITGCNSTPADGDLTAWAKHDAARWQLSDSGALHQQQTLATTLPAEAVLAAGAGVEDYVRLALSDNASIRAAQAKVRRLETRIVQESSLEDPMLEVTPIGAMGETAAGEVGVMTSISQKLPFPGKLDARGQIAAQDAMMAEKELQQARLDVAMETRQAYWSYYFAEQAIDVTQQSRNLLSQFHQAAESRYKANLATQQDVLRASVELSNVDNQLITLEQQRLTSMAMLNSLMDRPVTGALPAPRPVQIEHFDLHLNELLRQAALANPELGKIKRRIESERQRLRLAKLQRWPDLTVGFSYNFVDEMGLSPVANGKDQWWVSFGINVPIWFAKLRAGEREAHEGMQEGIAELTDAQNRIAFKVQDALVKVQTQQRLVVLFRDVIVPQARQALEASGSGYQAGKIDFLTLTDNWQNLLNYQLMYQQSLAELEKSYAELQQAVGRDLPRQTAPATQPAQPPVNPR